MKRRSKCGEHVLWLSILSWFSLMCDSSFAFGEVQARVVGFGPSRQATAVHNPDGDVLVVGSMKVLLGWRGKLWGFAGPGREGEDVHLPPGAFLSGREKLWPAPEKILPEVFRAIPAPGDVGWSQLRTLGLVCGRFGLGFFTQTRETQPPQLDFVSAERIERIPALAGRDGEFRSCVFQEDSLLALRFSTAERDFVVQASADGSSRFVEISRRAKFAAVQGGFLAIDSEAQSVILYDDALQVVGHLRESALVGWASLHLSARGRHALLEQEGRIWLISVDSARPNLLSLERLSLAPCVEQTEGPGCGLSVGSDGSWIVSGYWGTYGGKGSLFIRLPLANFSGEHEAPLISHSAFPGTYFVAGRDDADLGPLTDLALPEPVPQPVSAHDDVLVLEGEGAAWLKKGAEVAAGEIPLFVSSEIGVQVVLSEQFDPERHLFFESGLRFEPQLSEPKELAGESNDISARDFWWQEFLRYDTVWRELDSQKAVIEPVRVAVIDSGAALNHVDFRPNSPSDEVYGNGRDDDGNGYVDDTWGYDFVDEDVWPFDENGHGSHVAGLARPLHPLFDHIQLLILRALDRSGLSHTIGLGRAFVYAADRKAKVINASWGGGARTFFLQESIAYAQRQGSVVVTSAGNDRLDLDKIKPVPSIFPGVVSVGALTPQGRRAGFSNFGARSVLVFLPGSEILSLGLGGGFVHKSGTSMAAPLMSSLLALLFGLVQELPSDYSHLEGFFCGAQDSRGQSLLRDSVCGAPDLPKIVHLVQEFTL